MQLESRNQGDNFFRFFSIFSSMLDKSDLRYDFADLKQKTLLWFASIEIIAWKIVQY